MTRNELYAIIQGSNKPTFDEKLKFLEQQLLSSYSEDDIRIQYKKAKDRQNKTQLQAKMVISS